MSSLNGRQLSVVRLHVSTHAENIGNLGPVLDRNVGGKLLGATLTKVEGGVFLVCKKTEIFIPDTNIVSMQLINEANSKASDSSN